MKLHSQLLHSLTSTRSKLHMILWSAVLTGLCLGGALSFPFWYGLGLYSVPVAHREALSAYLSPDQTVNLWLPGIILGGVIWGALMARLVRARPIWRAAAATGIGAFIAVVIVSIPPFHRMLGLRAPPHIQWITDLVIAVGLGAGAVALSLGLALGWGRLAFGVALRVMLTSAMPALIVALVLDIIGIRWGAGNGNMAKIVGLVFPMSTFSAGALIGWYLAQYGDRHHESKRYDSAA